MPLLATPPKAPSRPGHVLVLDARRDRPACSPGTGNEVVVCARSTLPTTLLPIEIERTWGQVLVEPSGPDTLECNPDFLMRAGLATGRFLPRGVVGPVKVYSALANWFVSINGDRAHRDVFWTAWPTVHGADCLIGPRGLKYDSVRFVLGAPRPGAVTKTLPLDKGDYDLPYADLKIGKETLQVRFELRYDKTVLTAPATQIVGAALDGTAVGPIQWVEIMHGIGRPIRQLNLQKPLWIGPMRVQAPFARVTDYGEATRISAVASEESDPNDVVVAAKRPPPGRIRLLRVGTDDLSACSSIEVSQRTKQVTLTC